MEPISNLQIPKTVDEIAIKLKKVDQTIARLASPGPASQGFRPACYVYGRLLAEAYRIESNAVRTQDLSQLGKSCLPIERAMTKEELTVWIRDLEACQSTEATTLRLEAARSQEDNRARKTQNGLRIELQLAIGYEFDCAQQLSLSNEVESVAIILNIQKAQKKIDAITRYVNQKKWQLWPLRFDTTEFNSHLTNLPEPLQRSNSCSLCWVFAGALGATFVGGLLYLLRSNALVFRTKLSFRTKVL